jgi:hypothetical protein
MTGKTKYFIIILILAFLTACSPDEPEFEIPVSNRRTVLVYLGTDNNFRAEAAEKIEILRKNRNSANDGNLLVYSDAGGNAALIHIYHNPQKGNIADTITVYHNENSANPQTLTRVLNDVRTYRPADSYGLVVLSHATGWLPAEMSKPTPALRSIIWDTGTTENDNYMELTDFVEAIPYKLDFIIFDACFMGAVEVCYELKDKADYIVASPAEVVSPGFVYSTMMRHLFANPVETRLIASLQAVAQDFYEYHNAQSGLRRSATVSVVKTSELENLKRLYHSAFNADINGIQTFGYGAQKIYFDLGDCIQKFAPEKYNEFQSALDKCVIYKACTDSYYSAGTGTMQVIRAFGGLSTYIPQPKYPIANEVYGRLRWVR